MWVAVLVADSQKGVGFMQKMYYFLAFPPKMCYLCGDKNWFTVHGLWFTVYCLPFELLNFLNF